MPPEQTLGQQLDTALGPEADRIIYTALSEWVGSLSDQEQRQLDAELDYYAYEQALAQADPEETG